MSKVSIVFLTIFSLLDSAAVRRTKRDKVVSQTIQPSGQIKWRNQPSNYSDKLIDVLLRDQSLLNPENTEFISTNTSRKNGLVEIFLPGAAKPLFLCFPQNTEDYRRAYVLSHVICRQQGFMTVSSMNSKISTSSDEKLFYGLKPNSYSCTGQEQNVSHCEWNNINVGSCKAITELSCGDCQHTFKDSSGFIKAPGYPLVNIYDVTCEWDLMIGEDHALSLSFHNFRSLFVKSSKLFCNLHEPYMDIMYGRWNYRRFCNLDDIENMTIPHGQVKIKIFTGLYSQYGVNDEGKSVAITFEAKPAETSVNGSWQIIFVVLFLLIVIVIIALFHYCKKFGMCVFHRNRDTLPIVNAPPTLADIDRAYEFQRCAVQGPLKEKMGLRLRSNGSKEKNKNLFLPSFCPDETYIVSSVEKKNVNAKENVQNHVYNETPRSVIPEILLSAASDVNDELRATERLKVNLLDRYSKNSCDLSGISIQNTLAAENVQNHIYDETPRTALPEILLSPASEESAIERVKVNLLDRYSKSSCDLSGISTESTSPVFFPTRQSFQIYSSVSSDNEKEEKKIPPPNYDTAL